MTTSAVTGGRHTAYLSQPVLEKELFYSFLTLPLWVWSVSCTKISVLLMLLRIKQSTQWKRGIFAFIGFVLINAIAITIVQLVQCRPIKANWDVTIPRSACWNGQNILHATYAVSGESTRYQRPSSTNVC
jgi:hypothetical protein